MRKFPKKYSQKTHDKNEKRNLEGQFRKANTWIKQAPSPKREHTHREASRKQFKKIPIIRTQTSRFKEPIECLTQILIHEKELIPQHFRDISEPVGRSENPEGKTGYLQKMRHENAVKIQPLQTRGNGARAS